MLVELRVVDDPERVGTNHIFSLSLTLILFSQRNISYGACMYPHFDSAKAACSFCLFVRSFMGQLTASRFRGDTTFGLVSRIFATFFGGLVGSVMW